MLPGGKEVIAKFLYPRIPKGLPTAYPQYPTEEDGMAFLGNSHYQTGYVEIMSIRINSYLETRNSRKKIVTLCETYDFAL